MSNNKPIVWLIYPETPNSRRSERDILHTQVASIDWWTRWWCSWLFFWNRKSIQRLPTPCESELHQPQQIQELNRLLGGDVSLKRLQSNADNLTEAIQDLAPKSTVYILFVAPIQTALDTQLIDDALHKLTKHNHTGSLMIGLEEIDDWYTAMANQIRASFASCLPSVNTHKHVVLFLHRDHQNWSSLTTTVEKKSLLIKQRLQREISGCSIHIVLNAGTSLSILQEWSSTGELWFGFLQESCSHTPRLNPLLQNLQMKPLIPLNTSPAWMRMLREQVWNHTGTGP